MLHCSPKIKATWWKFENQEHMVQLFDIYDNIVHFIMGHEWFYHREHMQWLPGPGHWDNWYITCREL